MQSLSLFRLELQPAASEFGNVIERNISRSIDNASPGIRAVHDGVPLLFENQRLIRKPVHVIEQDKYAETLIRRMQELNQACGMRMDPRNPFSQKLEELTLQVIGTAVWRIE